MPLNNELISYQNAQQAGLDGRKPLELSQTVSHCLRLEQEFVSRWDAEIFCSEVAARDGKVFLKNGLASSFDDGPRKSEGDFRASIGLRDLGLRCGACSGFGVHVHRDADGRWVVKKLYAHSDGCKGGNVKGQLALEAYRKLLASGGKTSILDGIICRAPPAT
ncbi:hypothetical protein M885DRAFT_577883 [Pelagophyceae sp. CCMP2097]|nr:hypothetical protein M885DRAFT_577883 [Pelagophyceae sp. CCMP2097]